MLRRSLKLDAAGGVIISLSPTFLLTYIQTGNLLGSSPSLYQQCRYKFCMCCTSSKIQTHSASSSMWAMGVQDAGIGLIIDSFIINQSAP